MNEFDKDRIGTGTKEWAEVTENIQKGCQNNCLYCYAARSSHRFGHKDRSEWHKEELTKRADMKSYPARGGVVMFPSSHDITPFNLEAYIRVAKLILKKGNSLLIVSKPRLSCISALLEELSPWKDQILFRFTIGSMSDATCSFWEPGAPEPMERLSCLRDAYEAGYKTSVSIEPILGGIYNAREVVKHCDEWVTDTIWIGKMNKLRLRSYGVPDNAIKQNELLQQDAEIMRLYSFLKDEPKIRWKDSIKMVVANSNQVEREKS
jgi:DNA repair photolyase